MFRELEVGGTGQNGSWGGVGRSSLDFSPAWNVFGMWPCLCFWNTLPKGRGLGQKQRCHTEDPVEALTESQPGAGSSGATRRLESQQGLQSLEFHSEAALLFVGDYLKVFDIKWFS